MSLLDHLLVFHFQVQIFRVKADKESGVLLTKVFLRIVAVKKFQPNSTLKAWYMENVANSRNYLADYYTFNDLGLGEWAKKHRLSPKKKAIILKDNQPLINSADYGSYQARKRAIIWRNN